MARVRCVSRVPTVNVSTTPPWTRRATVRRWARRSNESAYALIEPDTSTNNTTRRGLLPRRRQLIRDGSPRWRRLSRSVREASTRPRCQRWCRAVRRIGARGCKVANIAASRCFSPADREPTSRCRSTSASRRAGVDDLDVSSSESPSPTRVGVRQLRGRGRGRRRRPGPGQAVAGVEERLEHRVEPVEVVGPAAQGRPAGHPRRALVGRGPAAPRPPGSPGPGPGSRARRRRAAHGRRRAGSRRRPGRRRSR